MSNTNEESGRVKEGGKAASAAAPVSSRGASALCGRGRMHASCSTHSSSFCRSDSNDMVNAGCSLVA